MTTEHLLTSILVSSFFGICLIVAFELRVRALQMFLKKLEEEILVLKGKK